MQIDLKANLVRAVNSAGVTTSAKLTYLISGGTPGESGASDALSLARATAPVSVGAAARREVSISRYLGGGVYLIDVGYAKKEEDAGDRADGDRCWKFDVSARRSHRDEAVRLVSATNGVLESAPDPGCLVNWNGRNGAGSVVGGVDVLSPELRESCLATFRASRVTVAFKRRIAGLVGKVNADMFHGWRAGEVLFLGVTQGSVYENIHGAALVDLYYQFAVRSTMAEQSVGGIAVGPVRGWHYLWSISVPDPATRQLKIAGIYVSQIYEEASFGALEL